MNHWTAETVKANNTRVPKPAYDKADRPPPSPEPERSVCHVADGAVPAPASHSRRIALRLLSRRRRLLDPDNLCPKAFIDGLRYAGLLPGDEPDKITLQITQEKVATAEDERTEIIIEPEQHGE